MEERFRQLYNHEVPPPKGAFDRIMSDAKPLRVTAVYARWFIGMISAGLVLLTIAINNQQLEPQQVVTPQNSNVPSTRATSQTVEQSNRATSGEPRHLKSEQLAVNQAVEGTISEPVLSNKLIVKQTAENPIKHKKPTRATAIGKLVNTNGLSLALNIPANVSNYAEVNSVLNANESERNTEMASDIQEMAILPIALAVSDSKPLQIINALEHKLFKQRPLIFSPYFFLGTNLVSDKYNNFDNVVCYRNKDSFRADGSNIAFEVGLSAIKPLNKYLSFQLSSGLYFDKYTTSYSALHVNATEQIKQHAEHLIEIIPDHVSEQQTYNHDMVAFSLRPELQIYPFKTSRFYLRSGLLLQFRINGAEIMQSNVRNQIELSRSQHSWSNASTFSNIVLGMGYHLRVSNSFIALEPNIQLPVKSKVNSNEMSIYRYQAGLRIGF
jgi:hypothetical protein